MEASPTLQDGRWSSNKNTGCQRYRAGACHIRGPTRDEFSGTHDATLSSLSSSTEPQCSPPGSVLDLRPQLQRAAIIQQGRVLSVPRLALSSFPLPLPAAMLFSPSLEERRPPEVPPCLETSVFLPRPLPPSRFPGVASDRATLRRRADQTRKLSDGGRNPLPSLSSPSSPPPGRWGSRRGSRRANFARHP